MANVHLLINLAEPRTRHVINKLYGTYKKKCGLLYLSLVPRSWRLALPILVETSNAEAHTCMYVPISTYSHRYNMGCHYTYPMSIYSCFAFDKGSEFARLQTVKEQSAIVDTFPYMYLHSSASAFCFCIRAKTLQRYAFSSNYDAVFSKNRSFIYKNRCKMILFQKNGVYLHLNLVD